MNTKIAIYTRVSTHFQVDKDSLKVQQRELIAYCQLILNCNDYTIFEDAGYSAKNTDRPEYQRMLNALRSGKYSHLLVWKIDRISRNLLDFATLYTELKKLGVTFVSKNEQFDTSSAAGEAMLKIILVFAELERQMTSERVSAVMLSRANNGQWNGGKVPYGYNYDPKTKLFSINEEQANIVKRIYSLYEQSHSILYVVRSLNNDSLTKKSWNSANVHKILTNPFYIGTYRYNKVSEKSGTKHNEESEWIVIEGHHEAIIPSETQRNVAQILSTNRRGLFSTDKTYVRKNIHIFSGILVCAKCGRKFSATPDKPRIDGYRPSMYGCPNRRNKSCTNKYISDVVLGPLVFSYLSSLLRARLIPDITFEQFSSLVTPPKSTVVGLDKTFSILNSSNEFNPVFQNSNSRYDELIRMKNKYENAMARLTSLYLYSDEAMPEKTYIIEKNEINEQLGKINAELEKTDVSESFAEKASFFIIVQQLLNENISYENYIAKIDPIIVKDFVRQVISKIVVDDSKITSITFKNGITHNFIYKN